MPKNANFSRKNWITRKLEGGGKNKGHFRIQGIKMHKNHPSKAVGLLVDFLGELCYQLFFFFAAKLPSEDA